MASPPAPLKRVEPDPRDYTLLLVDDEPNLRKVLGALLSKEGYEVLEAESGEAALEVLKNEDVQVVVSDLRMPGMGGLELLKKIRKGWPRLSCVMLTAHGTIDSAVEALKTGALDFLTKPFDRDEIRRVIAKAVEAYDRSGRDEAPAEEHAPTSAIVGQHPRIQEVFEVVRKVAASPSTVLITGESGTGKELVAQAIHQSSDRAGKPFVKINCAAIPHTLIESELFGYEKGAFTGAVTSKPGRFELADGGTLFLDEIGEIPLEMQVKLLHVLQEGVFERVGAVTQTKVDVRLVAATNRDLAADVKAGRFREDLFYRLNVVPMHLPPLRERLSDIPSLVEHFRKKFNKRLGRSVESVSPEAVTQLQAYHWPGNIRELENVMERAILFCEGSALDAKDLPPLKGPDSPGASPPPAAAAPGGDGAGSPGSLKDVVRQASRQVEKEIILKALQDNNWNVTRTARQLGVSRKGLQLKMKELGLRRE